QFDASLSVDSVLISTSNECSSGICISSSFHSYVGNDEVKAASLCVVENVGTSLAIPCASWKIEEQQPLILFLQFRSCGIDCFGMRRSVVAAEAFIHMVSVTDCPLDIGVRHIRSSFP
uniref:Uncharacterized protein n=1 Tax=Parascaris univalens TaxID=6257 RepID=A0A914ZKN2_PARUN